MRRTSAPGPFTGHPYLGLVAVLGGLVALRLLGVHSRSTRSQWDLFLYYTIITVGFCWVFGLSGQFAFSQAAFAGLGAFTSAYVSRQGVPVVAAIVVATALCALLAAAFGLLVRRAGAFYFAIATLGFSEIVLLVLRQWRGFTGADGGITDNVKVLAFAHWQVTTPYREAWVFLGVLAAVLLGGVLLERSPLRRDAITFRDQEVVAAVAGVPVLRVRLVTFALGSATAGVAGAVYAHTEGFLSPDSFDVDLGLAVFLMLIVGGTRSRWGPLLGAAFYVYSPTILDRFHLHQWTQIVYGVVLVVVMVVLPDGLAGSFDRLRRRPRRVTVSDESRPVEPAVEPAAEPPRAAELDRRSLGDEGGAVLLATGITVSFGGVRAVSGVDVRLARGEVLGLVGPNGSGKSTLLNALTGIVPAGGELMVGGRRQRLGRPGAARSAGLVRAFQTPQVYRDLSCLENVCIADPDRGFTGLAAAWLARPVMLRRERVRCRHAMEALGRVGLAGFADRRAGELPYGQQRLLELARSIAGEPTVLLLDEPSAGLNAAETADLAGFLGRLRSEGVALLVVDHKIDFVASLCDRVAVLELGKVVAEGPPVTVFADPRVIDAYLGVAHRPRGAGAGVTAGPDVEVGQC